MNKEQLLALGLTDEQVGQVLEGFKGYVPSSRFNEVNEAKKQAESLVAERDAQLKELKKSVGDNAELVKQIEQLQNDNKAAKAKYDADLQQFKIDAAVENALVANGALNLKATKALMDMSVIKVEGDVISGIEEQVKALREAEDSSFLFKGVSNPIGTKPAQGTNNPPAKTVDEMNYSELVAYMNNGGKLD